MFASDMWTLRATKIQLMQVWERKLETPARARSAQLHKYILRALTRGTCM